MTDDDRDKLLLRIDARLAEFTKDTWRRDQRIALLNRRVEKIGGWILGLESAAVVGGTIYLAVEKAKDALGVAGFAVAGFVLWWGIRNASKFFSRDELLEQDARQERHEVNQERLKQGLTPIQDPTKFETLLSYLLVLFISALVAGIGGGIVAIGADMFFLSRSFGRVAQWGLGALVAGFCGFGLMNLTAEGHSKWQAWRAKKRTEPVRPQSIARQKLVAGFLLGAGAVAVANAAGILAGQHRLPTGPGGWIDLAVQTLMCGVLFGGLGGVWGRTQDKRAAK